MSKSNEGFFKTIKKDVQGFNGGLVAAKFFIFHLGIVLFIGVVINIVVGERVITKPIFLGLIIFALIFSLWLAYHYKKAVIAGRLSLPS